MNNGKKKKYEQKQTNDTKKWRMWTCASARYQCIRFFFLLSVGFLICCVLHLLIPRRHNHVIDMPDKRLNAKKNERQPRSLVRLLSSMYVCLLDWMILKFMWVRCVVTHNPNRLTFRIFGIEHFFNFALSICMFGLFSFEINHVLDLLIVC